MRALVSTDRYGTARIELQDRLRARRGEIEEAILARVYGVSNPAHTGDPSYLEGLRTAVTAAIDYGFDSICSSERSPPPLPAAALVQARIAARNGIGLDTVLRRYFGGYALLGDFTIEEVEKQDLLGATQLKHLLRVQASLFDRLLVAVSEEHARESDARIETGEERRTELVKRLLAGESVVAPELAYDLEGRHLGLAVEGSGAIDLLGELAEQLGCRLLSVRPGGEVAWAWLGGGRTADPQALQRLASDSLSAGIRVAIGEPGEGLSGWRLTHRQACAALPVAMRGIDTIVRYADVVLLASILMDDLSAASLREIYLKPLGGERDGGEAARETLWAYFASGHNISSAASSLGVNRHTVTIRLRAIEERIGRNLEACAAELHTALRLERLTSPAARQRGRFRESSPATLVGAAESQR